MHRGCSCATENAWRAIRQRALLGCTVRIAPPGMMRYVSHAPTLQRRLCMFLEGSLTILTTAHGRVMLVSSAETGLVLHAACCPALPDNSEGYAHQRRTGNARVAATSPTIRTTFSLPLRVIPVVLGHVSTVSSRTVTSVWHAI